MHSYKLLFSFCIFPKFLFLFFPCFWWCFCNFYRAMFYHQMWSAVPSCWTPVVISHNTLLAAGFKFCFTLHTFRIDYVMHAVRMNLVLQLQMQFCVQFGLHLQHWVLWCSAINSKESHHSHLLQTQGTGNISGEWGSFVPARPQESTHRCLLRQIFQQLVFLVSPLHLGVMTYLNHHNVHVVFSVSSNDVNRQLKILKLSSAHVWFGN